MVAFIVNKALIEFIITAGGFTTTGFASRIGVSAKAAQMYRAGVYLPRKPEVVATIQALALEYNATDVYRGAAEKPVQASADAEHSGTQTDDPYTPEKLQAFEKKHGFTGKQAAKHVGVASSAWYMWRSGKKRPTKKHVIALLNAALSDDATKHNRSSNLKSEDRAKGGRALVATDKLHTFAKTFRDTYQARLGEAYVDYVLTHAADNYDIDRRTLRLVISSVLLVLKDRMTPQEIFETLSGHS